MESGWWVNSTPPRSHPGSAQRKESRSVGAYPEHTNECIDQFDGIIVIENKFFLHRHYYLLTNTGTIPTFRLNAGTLPESVLIIKGFGAAASRFPAIKMAVGQLLCTYRKRHSAGNN